LELCSIGHALVKTGPEKISLAARKASFFIAMSSLNEGGRMPRITYVQPDGNGIGIDVEVGKSVMQGALDNAIKGIVAECGGELACATCHCYVDDEWIEKVGPAGTIEGQMLDCAASSKKSGSRLSCQIVANDNLNGLVVYLPATQI